MSLTSYRAAPPRVTMWAALGSPEAFLCVHSGVAGLDGGLLHPASPCGLRLAARKRFCVSIPALPVWTAGCSTPRHHVGLRLAARKRFCVSIPAERVGLRGARVPRGCCGAPRHQKAREGPLGWAIAPGTCVNGLPAVAPASMPGDVLLFQRLSGSTIGAVRFHGRVRDGIGWVTDAMVTKQ
jgi:hypothetical protein